MTPEQFWTRVDRQGTDVCWEWLRSRNEKGYGIVWFRPERSQRAHHIAWELSVGEPIPADRILMHSCDNPACCNPNHLSIGTKADNMVDMANKGRRRSGLPGHRNLRAKLSEQDVLDIRANKALCRVTNQELAERFGVSRVTIGNVVCNRSHIRCNSTSTQSAQR